MRADLWWTWLYFKALGSVEEKRYVCWCWNRSWKAMILFTWMGPGFPGNQGRISKLLRYKREIAKKNAPKYIRNCSRPKSLMAVSGTCFHWIREFSSCAYNPKKDFFLQYAAVPVKKGFLFSLIPGLLRRNKSHTRGFHSFFLARTQSRGSPLDMRYARIIFKDRPNSNVVKWLIIFFLLVNLANQ